jgi:hypothetical protein
VKELNWRLVAYEGNKGHLMSCKLTRAEAKKEKKRLIKDLGVSPDILFVEQYTSSDYYVVRASVWRVYVVVRSRKYEYGTDKQANRKMVDRGKIIPICTGVGLNEARYHYQLAIKHYAKDRVKFEQYGSKAKVNGKDSAVEIHKDINDSKEFIDKLQTRVKLDGDTLKRKVLSDKSFVSGNAVNKNCRFVPGQLDFSNYTLTSRWYKDEDGITDNRDNVLGVKKPMVHSISIPCLNPYHERSNGYSSIAHLKDKPSKLADSITKEKLIKSRHHLDYSMLSIFIAEMLEHSSFVAVFRFLRNKLYLRNEYIKTEDGIVHSPIEQKTYCFIDIHRDKRDEFLKNNKHYKRCPRALSKDIVKRISEV